MRENLVGATWRLAIYLVVCLLGAFVLVAVFGQLRFQPEKTYKAVFANVSGLEGGNFVRIAGVEVGKVKNITIQPDSTVLVEFTAAESVVLTEGARAAIRFSDLIGGRYMALQEGAGAVKRLYPGGTIPLSRTEPALGGSRTGLGGRPFRIYKLRTMLHDCERETGPVWASAHDRRVTRVGKILRDTHLDELPQLWNVLRGEMSLIGPRPERPELAGRIEATVPGFHRRLMVKPGLTGLAQLRLPPDGEVEKVSKKLSEDLYYMTHQGPLLDHLPEAGRLASRQDRRRELAAAFCRLRSAPGTPDPAVPADLLRAGARCPAPARTPTRRHRPSEVTGGHFGS